MLHPRGFIERWVSIFMVFYILGALYVYVQFDDIIGVFRSVGVLSLDAMTYWSVWTNGSFILASEIRLDIESRCCFSFESM